MAPTAQQVLDAIKASGVKFDLQPRWNDPSIGAYGSSWNPCYVIEHHTANGGARGNAPSLGWVLSPGQLAPVRACHFLIGRDGLVYVIYALGCYHAGKGGPGQWGNGPPVSQDVMNRFAYGIEIESKGTTLDINGSGGTDGITDAQYEATARLTAALLDLIKRNTKCAINHRTWAPGRKSDTLVADSAWHVRIDKYRGAKPVPPTPTPTPPKPVLAQEAEMFVAEVQYGTNSKSFWLIGPIGADGKGSTGIGSDESASWTGPKMKVNDEATWRRILARYPQ